MLKIRLQRPFKSNLIGYHIVVSDSRSPRDGKFIEKLGTLYNNSVTDTKLKNYKLVRINKKKLFFWLSKGAQPTKTIKKIIHLL